MKKIISVVIIFTIFFSTCMVSFAETGSQNEINSELLKMSSELKNMPFQATLDYLNSEGLLSKSSIKVETKSSVIKEQNELKSREIKSSYEEGDYRIIKSSDNIISVINKKSLERTSYSINNKNSTISVTRVELDKNKFKKYNFIISLDNIEEPSPQLNRTFRAKAAKKSKIRWSSKVKENYKNEYWYRLGDTKKKDYMQIGCKAKYQLALSNLSSTKKSRCSSYRRQISSCISHFNKFKRTAAATSIGWKAVAALIIVNILYPSSVIVDVLLTAITGLTASAAYNMVENFITARSLYKQAEKSYNTIKVWGRKI